MHITDRINRISRGYKTDEDENSTYGVEQLGLLWSGCYRRYRTTERWIYGWASEGVRLGIYCGGYPMVWACCRNQWISSFCGCSNGWVWKTASRSKPFSFCSKRCGLWTIGRICPFSWIEVRHSYYERDSTTGCTSEHENHEQWQTCPGNCQNKQYLCLEYGYVWCRSWERRGTGIL